VSIINTRAKTLMTWREKMKKIFTTITIVLIVICFSTVSARAGAARRHTIEGFMLGTGAALLTAAIIKEIHKRPESVSQYETDSATDESCRYARCSTARYHRRHHRRAGRYESCGHWEVERTWVEPVYEKKWNPGHYNRRGEWVSGRLERFLIRDGYWKEEKVWVRY
jgi:hypothetical protein